jgi:uncharacterized protein (DUF2461 family)
MEIKYEFTEKEIELIKELAKINNTYNYSMEHDSFRDKYKKELSDFIDTGLLHHSNRGSEGAYIRYSVSSKGLEIFSKIK